MTISYEDELKRQMRMLADEDLIDKTAYFMRIIEFSKLIKRGMKRLAKQLKEIEEQDEVLKIGISLGVCHLYLRILDRKFEEKSIYIITIVEYCEIQSNLKNLMITLTEYFRKHINGVDYSKPQKKKKAKKEKKEQSDAVKIKKEKRKTIVAQIEKEQQEALIKERQDKLKEKADRKKKKASEKHNKKSNKKHKKAERKRKQSIKNAKEIIKENESKLRLNIVFNKKHLFAKVIKRDYSKSIAPYEVIIPSHFGNSNMTHFFTFKEFVTFLARQIKLTDVSQLSFDVVDIEDEEIKHVLLYPNDKMLNHDSISEYIKHAMSHIDKSLIERSY